MEHKKTMLDYIADCPEFIRNNVADSAALTKPLVDEYVSGGYKNIWIVACGSSSNGSLCARPSEVRGQDRHPVSFCIQRE